MRFYPHSEPQEMIKHYFECQIEWRVNCMTSNFTHLPRNSTCQCMYQYINTRKSCEHVVPCANVCQSKFTQSCIHSSKISQLTFTKSTYLCERDLFPMCVPQVEERYTRATYYIKNTFVMKLSEHDDANSTFVDCLHVDKLVKQTLQTLQTVRFACVPCMI